MLGPIHTHGEGGGRERLQEVKMYSQLRSLGVVEVKFYKSKEDAKNFNYIRNYSDSWLSHLIDPEEAKHATFHSG